MTITQIGPTYYSVSSRSRDEVEHNVDLDYREHEKDKPKIVCSCEAYVCHPKTKGQPCPHILAVLEYKKRLGL